MPKGVESRPPFNRELQIGPLAFLPKFTPRLERTLTVSHQEGGDEERSKFAEEEHLEKEIERQIYRQQFFMHRALLKFK